MNEGGPATVAIVAVGNELLFGETVDTNSAWIGRTLAAWGLRVRHGFTVGDVAGDIAEAVERAHLHADLVVVTGGLGPTSDDLTKPVVAALFDRALVTDERVLAAVRARYGARGIDDVSALALRQAEVPAGTTALANTRGTAPGILFESDGRLIVLLPGVPSEMRGIVNGPFREVLERRGMVRPGVLHRVIHTTGIAESRLAELLEEPWRIASEEAEGSVALAYLPDEGGVDLRLSADGAGASGVAALLEGAAERIRTVVQEWRYEAADGDLATGVAAALRRLRYRLATAESCTGGLVAKRMTDAPGSSDVFVGGIVAYANEVKIEQLGVTKAEIDAHGAVSEPVVRAMVSGVVERFGATAGIAITGVAGPGGGSAEKPVGTVWIATSVEGSVEATRTLFPGGRGETRRRAAQAALAALYRRLRTT